MTVLLWIFRFAFGCHHSRLSGVFTIKKRTYQVCLECGQEFEYSWHGCNPCVQALLQTAMCGRPVLGTRCSGNLIPAGSKGLFLL